MDQQTELGHGRLEKRICSVINDLSMIAQSHQWKGLQSIIKIQTEQFIKSTKETQRKTRYYISSLKAEADQFNQNIRDHWKIETHCIGFWM